MREKTNIEKACIVDFRLVENFYLLNVLKNPQDVMELMIVKMDLMRKIAFILAIKRINFNVFIKIINHCLWNVFQKINTVME
jgi:hypothetical protein